MSSITLVPGPPSEYTLAVFIINKILSGPSEEYTAGIHLEVLIDDNGNVLTGI